MLGFSYPAPELGILGHHIRDISAIQNCIMNSCRGFYMFAKHVEAVGEEFQPVERAAAVPGVESGVRCLAFELDYEIDHRLRTLCVHLCLGIGVPGETDIQVIEETLACHIEFAADRLLGWSAIKAYCPLQFSFGDQLLHSQSRSKTCSAEEIV